MTVRAGAALPHAFLFLPASVCSGAIGVRVAAFLVALSTCVHAEAVESSAPEAKPAVVCAEPRYDFGEVPQGRLVEHTFVIENRGSAPLNIESVAVSCSCTTAPLTETIVQAGGTTEIKASFDSTRFEGPVEKTITVMSDDPLRPELEIEITGIVTRPFEVVPDHLDLGNLDRMADFETRVTLTPAGGRPVRIRSVEVHGDHDFETRLDEELGAHRYIIILRLKDGVGPHLVDGALVVTFDDDTLPPLRISFQGRVVGDVSYFPEKLDFGTASPGELLRRRILFVINRPGVKILSAEADPRCFELAIVPRAGTTQPADPGSMPLANFQGMEIRITVKKDAPAGEVKGAIHVQTTARDQATIRVPISGMIKAR